MDKKNFLKQKASVGIVISTCNERPDIPEKAILSCLNQKNISFSILVTDDSNDDSIYKMVMNINDKRVSYLKHDCTGYAASNWNFGIRKLKSEYILLLHSDEYFIDNFALYRAMQAMIKNKLDFYVFGIVVKNKNKIWFRSNFIRKILKKWPSFCLLFNFYGSPSNILFKKNYFIPFNEKLKILVDVIWYVNFLKDSKIGISEDVDMLSDIDSGNIVTKSFLDNSQIFKEYNLINSTLNSLEKFLLFIRVFLISPIRVFLKKI